MENVDIKIYARYFIGLLLFALGLMYFSVARFMLLPLLLGALLMIVVVPINNRLLEAGLSKNMSAFMSVGIVVLILLSAVYLCLMPLIRSAKEFFISLPTMMLGIQNRLGISKILYTLGISNIITDAVNIFVEDIISIQKILIFLSGTVKWLYVFFLTPIFAFYILRDRRDIRKGIDYIIPHKQKGTTYQVLKEIYIGISTYIYGYLFISLVCMATSLICFRIINLESSLFLSFFIGICSFIPFIGPFIGGIPAIIVASNYGWQLWYVVVVILILFQIAASVLTPKTIGNSVNVHPIFGILAMVLGYGLFGVWGILLAVPVFVILRPIIKYIFSVITTN